jgi:hypothetical protein
MKQAPKASVCRLEAFTVWCNLKLWLIGSIRKLQGENKVLLIRPWVLYSQHFIFFVYYET